MFTDFSEVPPPSEKLIGHLSEHYDAGIRFVDLQIRVLVDELKKAGEWDSTLFIVVSDHGESLGEHGHFRHQLYLYEYLIQAPLIIRWPGHVNGGTRTDTRVSLVDLFPTILEAADIDPGDYPCQGYSLLGPPPGPDRPLLYENYMHEVFREGGEKSIFFTESLAELREKPVLRAQFAQGLKAYRAGDLKLIRADGGRVELYDLASDPKELDNLADSEEHKSTVTRMSNGLDRVLEEYRTLRNGDDDSKALTDSEVEDLNAMGYL